MDELGFYSVGEHSSDGVLRGCGAGEGETNWRPDRHRAVGVALHWVRHLSFPAPARGTGERHHG